MFRQVFAQVFRQVFKQAVLAQVFEQVFKQNRSEHRTVRNISCGMSEHMANADSYTGIAKRFVVDQTHEHKSRAGLATNTRREQVR